MTPSPRSIAFIMDPPERVNPETDTTYAFIRETLRRDYVPLYVPPQGVDIDRCKVVFHGAEVSLGTTSEVPLRVETSKRIPATDCAAVFLRTDPPFDQRYLETTWLLELAANQGVTCVNHPVGVRDANEKLFALHYPELGPETVVTSDRQSALEAVESFGGEAIGKPLDGHGGYGVIRLRTADSNVTALIDMLSSEGKKQFLVQEFLPTVVNGDKRLFFLDGKLRAAVMRQPAEGEHRSNVHVGGSVVAAELDDCDRKIEERVGPDLKRRGILFAGIDVIAGKLIEVNVTSPTLIQELARVGGPDLAQEVVALAVSAKSNNA